MSVAVFSRDAELARMLLLQAKQCGLAESTPERAAVWLMDLDQLPPLPKGAPTAVRIGFSAEPDLVDIHTRLRLFALLSLPFSARELSELLTRTKKENALLRDGEEMWLSGKRLHFSNAERRVLSLLYENRDRVIAADEIAAILGEQSGASNAVAVYLYRLRRKLEADGTMRIRTVRGVGYQWIGDGLR